MQNLVLCDSSLSYLNNLEKALNKIIFKNNFCANISFRTTDDSDLLDYIKENKTDILFLDSVFESKTKRNRYCKKGKRN